MLPFAVKEMKEIHFSSTLQNVLIFSHCCKYAVIILLLHKINQNVLPVSALKSQVKL